MPQGLHHHEFVVARAVSAVSSLGTARAVSTSNSSSLSGVTANGGGIAWSSEPGGWGSLHGWSSLAMLTAPRREGRAS